MAALTSLTGGYIDFSQPSLYISAATIAFNPLFWNIVARNEYHNKTLTSIFGSPRTGCYSLALTIFTLGLLRDFLFERALRAQPLIPTPFHSPPLAYALLLLGNTLVLTSYYALGITGTFLGDYFGILMDAKVTGFPFNVSDAPMYWGSTCSFLGTSFLYGRPAGLLLTVEVAAVYLVARRWEDPFTGEIYAKRDRERETMKAGGKKGN